MALIVEDGSQVAGAESYISTTAASTYHSNRGNSAWALLTTGQMEEALRRATDYMVQAYRGAWKGFRVSSSQALDWPRANVAITDGPYGTAVALTVVPQEVKNACAEFALRAASGVLAADLEQQTLSESVGALSVTYDKSSPQYARYRAIDMMLQPYLSGGGVTAKLERI
jgi:hypothetical protein